MSAIKNHKGKLLVGALLGLVLALGFAYTAFAGSTDDCAVTVSIPEGTWVQVNGGVGWKQNGQTFQAEQDTTVKYRACNATKGICTGWTDFSVDCSALAPGYCAMGVDIPADTWVEINGGVGWRQNGAELQMPSGTSFKYRACNATKGICTGWQTKDLAGCSALAPEYCAMKVEIPADTWVEINGGVGWRQNGVELQMPRGTSFKYRACNATKGICTGWETKDLADCSALAPAYCAMGVDIPADTWVEINGGVGWRQNGAELQMPSGTSFKYRACNETKGICTGWQTKDLADCSALAPGYCAMEVDIPADTWVEINGGVGWKQNGAELQIPKGTSFKYRACNATKGICTGWQTKDLAECTPLAPDYCAMKVQLEKGVWAQVEINGGVGWKKDGDVVQMPMGSSFKYRALDINGKSTCWQTKEVDCTPLVPGCKVTVKLPPGVYVLVENKGWFQDGATLEVVPTKTYRYDLYDATKHVHTGWKSKVFTAADCCNAWDLTGEYCNVQVDLDGGDGWVLIENVGWFQNGAKVWMPGGATFRYDAYDSTQKVRTGWQTKKVDCTALKPGYCNMLIDLEEGGDGKVYIENVGWFQNGNHKWMPKGASFRYDAYDSTQKVHTGWQTKQVGEDCSALKPGYCHMLVDLEGGDGWVYIENVGWFGNGAQKWMPTGASFRYDAYDSTQKVHTGWQTKQVGEDCSALKPGYCNMLIDLEEGGDGYVYIENVGWFGNGEYKWMPTGASFRYDAYDSTKKVHAGWQTKEVDQDCSALKPGYCHMLVDLDGGDGKVVIENVGWFNNGDYKWMPMGATFRYDAYDSSQKVHTGWQIKEVDQDCSALKPGYCNMLVSLEAGVWAKVLIENVGWFTNGNYKWMPMGASFRYDAYDVNGAHTGWQTKTVDCTPLVPQCKVHIVLPSGVWVEISGVGWFQNDAWLDVKPVKGYRYRLWNAAKSIAGPWKDKQFSAADCGKDWNLTGEYCNLDIDLGASDGWVEISGVGWFQTATGVAWLPNGATVRYRLWNKAKSIAGPWKDKPIDCTPLKDEDFCNLDIDLGASDGWVEISGVGWFQTATGVAWLPNGATVRYRLWDKAKSIAGPWKDKPIDCTPLKDEDFCNLDIDLGASDGWVEISGVGWFQTATGVAWLPKGASVNYRLWDKAKSIAGPWKNKPIDCTPLKDDDFCYMKIVLTDPSDGWFEISGVGWFQNGGQVWLPMGATVRYRVWNASKSSVVADWMDKAVDCTDLVYPKVTVTVTPGYDSNATLKAAVKYRNLINPGGLQGFEGILGNPAFSPSVQNDFYRGVVCDGSTPYGSWNATNHVKFIYDAATQVLAARVDANPSYCMELNLGDLGSLNYLQLDVVNRATGTSVNFNNVTLNGNPLGSFTGSGWSTWQVKGLDFSSGFTVEGDLVLAWPSPPATSGQETNKLQITVGSLP